MNENQREKINLLEEARSRQLLDKQIETLNEVKNNPKALKRYNIFQIQCKINSILDKIIKFVNSKSLIKVTPYNEITLGTVISEDEIDEFIERNEIVEFDEDINISKLTMNQIRDYLYELYDLEPVKVEEDPKNFNVAVMYAAGLNPDGLNHEVDNYYLDNSYYVESGLFNDFVLKGEIYGVKIAKKTSKTKQ